MAPSSRLTALMERPVSQINDQSRSLVTLDQDSTLIAVIEMSQSSWLVGGLVPGLAREPRQKLAADGPALLALLHRWREAAAQAGRPVVRICVAYEAGRDGFWLARWLRMQEVECHVIHPTSIAVSREHRRAKTDRLDLELLKRAFLGCPSTSSGARRTKALQHGADPEPGRGGCRAPQPRTADPDARGQPHGQPDQGDVGAARHPRRPSQAAGQRIQSPIQGWVERQRLGKKVHADRYDVTVMAIAAQRGDTRIGREQLEIAP